MLDRQRLQIAYVSRGTNERTEREISPQRLVHYRENWYCDAWCHLREDLRSFAVDAIQSAELVDRKAKPIAERDLDEVLASGYGIFSGRKTTWAKLRFTAERARWVSVEAWHPEQKGRFEPDGRYVLELPFSDPAGARDGRPAARRPRGGPRAGQPARRGAPAARRRAEAVRIKRVSHLSLEVGGAVRQARPLSHRRPHTRAIGFREVSSMDHHRSLGDRAVAIASALAILFAVAFGAEPARETHPQLAHRAAR